MKTTVIKLGRIISTTDRKLAARLGAIVKIDELTHGQAIDCERTDEGTICFWLGSEFIEVEALRYAAL